MTRKGSQVRVLYGPLEESRFTGCDQGYLRVTASPHAANALMTINGVPTQPHFIPISSVSRVTPVRQDLQLEELRGERRRPPGIVQRRKDVGILDPPKLTTGEYVGQALRITAGEHPILP